MRKIKCILLFVALFFSYNTATAQIAFENSSLKTLHAMASQSNYAMIKESMKGNGITLIADEKDRDGNDLLTYDVQGTVKMSYCYSSKNKKLIYARMDIPKRFLDNFMPLFDELMSKGFEQKVTKRWAITDEPMAVSYLHKDYPYSYILYEVYKDVYNIFIFNLEFGDIHNFSLQ